MITRQGVSSRVRWGNTFGGGSCYCAGIDGVFLLSIGGGAYSDPRIDIDARSIPRNGVFDHSLLGWLGESLECREIPGENASSSVFLCW